MTKQEWKKWWRAVRIAATAYAENYSSKHKGDIVNVFVRLPLSKNSTRSQIATFKRTKSQPRTILIF